MSDAEITPLQKFIEGSLDMFATKLSESDRQAPAEVLARLFVDAFASPEFWTEDIKTATSEAMLPIVLKWLRGD